jgi:ribonuclease Z
MRPIFEASLVNDASGDPGVYIDFRSRRRALLIDLGDNAVLAPRRLLRVSHAFVSHTHMDHFIGFDRLVRICVGRHAGFHVFGPPGFVDQVERRLAAYTWDRVDRYEVEFALTATEIDEQRSTRSARFRSRACFEREPLPPACALDGVLLDEPGFRVRCALLDHRTPCLGFAVEEKTRISIRADRLAALDVKVGPWVSDLKRLALAGARDDERVRARWREAGADRERELSLGALKPALEFVPGRKICYVTDVVCHEPNRERIVELAQGADQLFIECVFLDEDAAHARDKQHLTAREAGTIARLAGAREVVPFHFSPRYTGREDVLRAELDAAFRGA